MFPPIYTTLQDSATVRAIFGARPRVYRHGEAPQLPSPKAGGNVPEVKPYATWLLVSAVPENNLSSTPSHDRDGVQIDVYARGDAECVEAAQAIRDRMETVTHMTALRGLTRDVDTRLYRISMDFDFWLAREA